MNYKRVTVAIVVLALAVAVLIDMRGRRLASNPESASVNATVSSHRPKTVGVTVLRGSNVVVQIGELRMSNAVSCMAYIKQLADKMPTEQRRHFMGVAGVLFFDDCLMVKMKDGYIRTTTNELRAALSNALTQVFTNQIPDDVKAALNGPPPEGVDWGHSPQSMYDHEKRLAEHPDVALVEGFQHALSDRNNFGHMSVDDQYNYFAQTEMFSRTFGQINSAIAQAGIADAPQSDLRELCIALGSTRTTIYMMYGSTESAKDGGDDAQIFQSYVGPLNDVFAWRLSNMYQLDGQYAQALIQAMSVVPVSQFSSAGAQPPAWIE